MKALARAAATLIMIVLAIRSRPRDAHESGFATRAERARAPIVRFIVKHPLTAVTAVGAVLMLGGAAVMISGVVPIKASTGHWPITALLLDFAKLRSVATYSLGINPPPLDDAALVLRGASHYAIGCHPCHGGPAGDIPPIMQAMTPPPPALTDGLSRYRSRELFSIVKHGIKFTGMPAWPAAQRDDEVWALVAFLRRMAQLTPGEYHRLAAGAGGVPPATAQNLPMAAGQVAPQAAREICWRCHDVDGTGRGAGAFPSLAGQRAEYLYLSLHAYATRRRYSGIMTNVAASLTDDTMRQVAQYYSSLPPREAGETGDSSAAPGAMIAARGVPERDIPACVECHGPTEMPKNPAFPRLAGQHGPYLALQLQLLRERRRGGSSNVNLMHAFVDRLDPEHVSAVTRYYASLRQ
jgi:cytochrome c553